MKFFCDQCNAQYMIADEKVGPKGVKVKCKKCSHVILVKPAERTVVDASPRPTAVGAAASKAAPAAQPRRTEAEISGAFDSLFGGGDPAASSGQGAFGGAAAKKESVPAPSSGGDREWYVAIGDSQVGPIGMGEIE